MSESITNLKEIEAFLDSIPKFSKSGKNATNFDLSRMEEFCDRLGNSQNDFKSIHVAGTNGKGTVCRMLASVYQEAGYNVGLYTSPHLVDFRERFQINAKFAESDLFIEFFDRFGEYIREKNFTYFEMTTAIAFWIFSQQKIDLAVLEVGLGGRLDATNVVDPLISVITSIGLDHTDILGHSIEKIASEKAGIIKQNKPVVIGKLPSQAKSTIQKIAKDRSAKFVTIEQLETTIQNRKITLQKEGEPVLIDAQNWKEVDTRNIAIVYKVLRVLKDQFPVSQDIFTKGIENVQLRFPRRAVFEKLSSGYNWYFDGAHNEQSVKSLTSHLISMAPASEWRVVLSFMRDKLSSEIAELWSKFDHLYLYEMEGERAATFDEMKTFFPTAKTIEFPDQIISNQFKSELVIFSGSFYFYSVVSNWMGAIASADHLNPSAL
ncbi:bifunctional folylpolyglutamate synthase/dihydrofolate synthase [Rhodohalobacter sulfatireducens]|uniref:Dihydrofolate synthase/folylpolyglutamate synthase n=1 Tax=Rhodohalobacter sulfatireducens TaxID=2911366 RepID=A0ABS9KCZ2_9BACT|nr:folylpolyglutamate synthase/dihydrofolate synthase family protein [Rhodohalobacter sulfatireducens]MCG2588695.1 bifunctional folylpolyglutamate synthase/dihydrofolate synthase [Rhodohalobacter sulfatireducens]